MSSTPQGGSDGTTGNVDRERQLNLALAASGLHVWTYRLRTRRISIAEALCKALDLDVEQCARPGWWRRRICEEDRAHVVQAFRDCLRGGEDLNVEFRVRLASGNLVWFALHATLIAEGEGGPHLYGVCADITARRLDEERLRNSEHQLRTVNDAIPVGIARCSRDGHFLFVNRSYAQDVLRRPAGDIIGKPIADVIGSEAMVTRAPHIDRVLNGEQIEVSTDIDLKGVGRRMIHLRIVPEFSPQGDVTSWIEVLNDVTERARVEGQLYQREREFQTLVENAPDIIARLDHTLRYRYINRAAESIFGLNLGAIVGGTGAELGLPASMQQAIAVAAREALSSGRERLTSFDVDIDHQRRYFNARLIPEFDVDACVESLLMVVYDVTERVQAQQERERLLAAESEARRRAEAAAASRDQFLAIVTHELRSPLNGIQNWANVLQGQMATEPSAMVRRALTGIKTGVDQQVRLIDDLLDAARILNGKLSLTRQAIVIRPVVEDAIASVSAAATARNIEIITSLQLDREQVYGDPDRIQQIAWNLLSNSLKFTEPGGHIHVTLDRQASSIRLRVADDGKGISPDFLPRMFDWFGREETSSQRGPDGLGLGLALVRHLCTLHGGTVSAASAGVGKGSQFEVRLPLLQGTQPSLVSAADETTAPAFPSLAGMSVIVIDDQDDALEALSALLISMQASVRTFASGGAFVAWMRLQPTHPAADVVLCDVAMPDQDGYATVRALRELEDARKIPASDHLPVIALTAFAHHEIRQRALQAGFALHLVKPVSADELAAALRSVARH